MAAGASTSTRPEALRSKSPVRKFWESRWTVTFDHPALPRKDSVPQGEAVLRMQALWLVSQDSDGMTGLRSVATKWRTDQGGKEAAEAAIDRAGWQYH